MVIGYTATPLKSCTDVEFVIYYIFY